MTLRAGTDEDALRASVVQGLEMGYGVYLDASVPSAMWAGTPQSWMALWSEIGPRAAGAMAREGQPYWREHPVLFLEGRLEREL